MARLSLLPQAGRHLVELETDARLYHVSAACNVQDENYSKPGDKLFMQKKDSKRTWAEHYVSDACPGQYRLYHGWPDLMNVMRAKYDPTRVDYLRHAEELAQFAQSIELCSGAVGRKVVTVHFDAKRKEARTCYNCGKVGHVQADCRPKGRNGSGKPNNASRT